MFLPVGLVGAAISKDSTPSPRGADRRARRLLRLRYPRWPDVKTPAAVRRPGGVASCRTRGRRRRRALLGRARPTAARRRRLRGVVRAEASAYTSNTGPKGWSGTPPCSRESLQPPRGFYFPPLLLVFVNRARRPRSRSGLGHMRHGGATTASVTRFVESTGDSHVNPRDVSYPTSIQQRLRPRHREEIDSASLSSSNRNR